MNEFKAGDIVMCIEGRSGTFFNLHTGTIYQVHNCDDNNYVQLVECQSEDMKHIKFFSNRFRLATKEEELAYSKRNNLGPIRGVGFYTTKSGKKVEIISIANSYAFGFCNDNPSIWEQKNGVFRGYDCGNDIVGLYVEPPKEHTQKVYMYKSSSSPAELIFSLSKEIHAENTVLVGSKEITIAVGEYS